MGKETEKKFENHYKDDVDARIRGSVSFHLFPQGNAFGREGYPPTYHLEPREVDDTDEEAGLLAEDDES
jgi:hypothetical protein